MNNRSRLLVGATVSAAVLALLTACTSEKGTPTPQTTSAASTSAVSSSTTGTATAFDPCTALTPEFLAQHQWDARAPEHKQTTTGAFTWKGCAYLAQARYTFGVQTTNGTLAQVREKFPTATELTIDGRKALRYEARPDVPGGCTVNLDMKSGSLYILVDDPRGLHPRKLSPCDNATEIAEAVVSLLPQGS
ncbi:DUF3558 domain-containing protein [Nocardia sp. NBC_00565]|uniref:DUF3558 domain-containing protein n=1 Tax=Nocardia sp. NBC_00565 TaxID=2975993 RepID=UPI002E8103BE|nr:DUF3558 domain-containing protein [Nocardia sp. NBC_00565]WUC05324.1 DUF3558 domain-containing protein [Nocardia sp. NBC_00565]